MQADATVKPRLKWELEFERRGGEPGLLERLRTRYTPEIDVDIIAKDSVDFAARKSVTNINGLIINRVRAAYARATRKIPASPAERAAENDRIAAFAVQLYQVISEQGLPPNKIADYLEEAVRAGLRLNLQVIERLRDLGHQWPRA